MDRAQTLDAVDMLDAFVDQAITLAMQPTVMMTDSFCTSFSSI